MVDYFYADTKSISRTYSIVVNFSDEQEMLTSFRTLNESLTETFTEKINMSDRAFKHMLK